MAYTHTTWSTLQSQLSARLDDSGQLFWTSSEVVVLLTEALRTFGALSGFWRERGTVAISSGTAFYDIVTNLTNGVESILAYSVTDRDLIQAMQFHLLEDASSQSAWNGTEQFVLADLTNAIQRRRDQFLADTGIVVDRSVVSAPPPPNSRVTLVDTIIDVRRVAWLGASPLNYYVPMWREDERLLTAAGATWSTTSGTPEAWSVTSTPPLQLQLAPPPVASGQLELLAVSTGASLDPTTSATVLGIPDDLTPGVKWGALADLLDKDGAARDPGRAAYCEQRYQQYVQLARVAPVVVHAEVNGVATIPSTVQELDSSEPNWQNRPNTPTDVAIAAPNLIAVSPMPNVTASVTLDVVRRTPVPALGSTNVSLGREQLDAILDYAEHLALFKVGGNEFEATQPAAARFAQQALTFNERLSAATRSLVASAGQSRREDAERPRRLAQASA